MTYRFHQEGTYKYKDVIDIDTNIKNHDCESCVNFVEGGICSRLKSKIADMKKGCDKHRQKGGQA